MSSTWPLLIARTRRNGELSFDRNSSMIPLFPHLKRMASAESKVFDCVYLWVFKMSKRLDVLVSIFVYMSCMYTMCVSMNVCIHVCKYICVYLSQVQQTSWCNIFNPKHICCLRMTQHMKICCTTYDKILYNIWHNIIHYMKHFKQHMTHITHYVIKN